MSTEQSSPPKGGGRMSRRSSDHHPQNRIPNDHPHGLQSTISFYMDQNSTSASSSFVVNQHGGGGTELVSMTTDLTSMEGVVAVEEGKMLENDQQLVTTASKITPGLGEKMPMVPLRKFQQKEGIVVSTVDPDTLPSWYVVLSPRETIGAAGPFTVNDLRIKFKEKDIHEKTLAWCNGNATWHELRHMPYLFHRWVNRYYSTIHRTSLHLSPSLSSSLYLQLPPSTLTPSLSPSLL